MQEVVIQSWCDICYKDDKTRTETTFADSVSVGTLVRRLELCDKHTAEYIGDLAQVLRTYGSRLEGRGPSRPPAESSNGHDQLPADWSSEGLTCPRCGKPLSNQTSVLAHARNIHSDNPLTMEEMRQLVGPDEELIPCEVDGCKVISLKKFGYSTHLRVSHKGYQPVS